MPALISRMFFKTFLALDRVGVHVLPKHYYSPIPDYQWLRRHPEIWNRRAPMTGVAWELDEQLASLGRVCGPYYHEVKGFRLYERLAGSGWGPGFGPIESQVLHCFMRALAPPRVIEIGSGVSTACMLHAAALNEREGRPKSEITCIEPYPSSSLKSVSGVTLLAEACQTVPASVFARLQPGDLLFVDSSHAVRVGSDVIRIYLEIIPQLTAGVHIHVHDIFLPYMFGRSVLHGFYSSQETALLLALLTDNQRLSIIACLSALHYDRPDQMKKVLCDYKPQENVGGLRGKHAHGHFPSSCWLRA